MISRIAPRELPGGADNLLFADYLDGAGTAREFYTHAPDDWLGGLQARSQARLPRQQVAALLKDYQQRLGARERTMANVEALAQESTFCVITGQQAGFLGGPAYTAYKIATAIRLADHLQRVLHVPVVPMFWLATEDHDFHEINHVYYIKPDHEIGRVSFAWHHVGRPISDLPLTDAVWRAYEDYLERLQPGPGIEQVKRVFSPLSGEGFGGWQARMWLNLFSESGLVVVEPWVLRPASADFACLALEHSAEISGRLQDVTRRLREAGYSTLLDAEQAGRPYTFDKLRMRVRVEDPSAHVAEAREHPEQYSMDAALRPLMADALLPVLASVLGPSEIAYQGMLRPLYELLGIPQPILFPRQSYTMIARWELERIEAYGLKPETLIADGLDMDAPFLSTVPESDLQRFAAAGREMREALEPLREYVESIEPSLLRTWEQTVNKVLWTLDKLQSRALQKRMRQLGFSKAELRALYNALYPRGRLQERVLPLPHFINRYGLRFLDLLLSSGDLMDWSHEIVVVEEEDA